MLISELQISLPRKKGLNKVKTPANLKDLDVDFGLERFKLCLFVNKGDEETDS